MPRTVLLTGATGYVGGRLLPLLLDAGHRVRCLARRPRALAWVPAEVEVCEGDLLEPSTLRPAFAGVDTALYLVHSMGEGADFAHTERRAAVSFGRAAKDAGTRRIVYLGGLGDDRAELSRHLRSRHQVGELLRASGVPVTELRASVILGAGSVSFELIRALVERLPVMIMPRWVRVPTQPIWVGDVLEALLWAVESGAEEEGSRVYEIGGPDVVSFGELMREYARQRGLRRWMIPVPFLTPRLSSLWLALVTPVYARVGRSLIDGIRHPTVVRAEARPPAFGPPRLGVAAAIARTLAQEEQGLHARWADATWLARRGARSARAGRKARPNAPGNRVVDARSRASAAEPAAVFEAVERIGGGSGWYAGDALWRVRGWLDLLAGGVGMRRGRRDPARLRVGDALDCWRVEEIEPGRRLLLHAEMKLPGRGWLEFLVEPGPGGRGSVVQQTASFDPLGLRGLIYWHVLAPLHHWIFDGMLRGIVRAAESCTRGTEPTR